jgi:phage terminase small subunit
MPSRQGTSQTHILRPSRVGSQSLPIAGGVSDGGNDVSEKLPNARHERFCQEYLLDLNATAAYRRTYPKVSQKAAEASGPRLLGNVRVAARVAALQATRSERLEVTADMVVRELAGIGFSDMRTFSTWGPSGVQLIDSENLTDLQAKCVAEVSETTGEKSNSLRFKLHDKVAALVKLGQHLGMFTEKHEHAGAVVVRVIREDAPVPSGD